MSAPLSRNIAPLIADHGRKAGIVTMTPVSFGDRAGWLHEPETLIDGAAGVVLVSPLGRDARCAHRPMRLMADQLARAGYPALRFDHIGHGDSLDLADEGDALPEWIAGVRAAADFLKDVTGVRRIVLGGARFGATLAILAAADGADVEGLILLAPVVSGKAWLRELRLAGAMSGTTSEAMSQAGGLEADGLILSPATVASLATLDLKATVLSPRPSLLFAQNEGVAAFGECLKRQGGAVSVRAFSGYDSLFEDAHSNQSPDDVIAQAVQWIRNTARIDREAVAGACPRPPAARLAFGATVETPVEFGDGLRGVITRPDAASAARGAVIFLNTGGDPRAGIGRFAVVTARALAAQGLASLRFDFPGVGDSADPADGRRHIYEVSRTADIQAAVAVMRAEGFGNITLAGVCAGGYHAIQAVIAGVGVRNVLAVSPVKLVWRQGDSLAIGKPDQGRATAFYVGGLKNPATWKRLLTGKIHVRSVLKTLSGRLIGRFEARRDVRAKVFHDQIAAASARGVKVKILVGMDDSSLDEIETYFGPKGARMNRLSGMSVSVAPGIDHGLARAESRARALQELVDLIGPT